jgi:purine catabolism regulator
MSPTSEPDTLRGDPAGSASAMILLELERLAECRLWPLSRRGDALLPGRGCSPPAEEGDPAILRIALPAGDGVLVCKPRAGAQLDDTLLTVIADVVAAVVAVDRGEASETLSASLTGRLDTVVVWDRFRRLGLDDDHLALVLVAPLPDATDEGRRRCDLCDSSAIGAVTEIEEGTAALVSEALLPALTAALGPFAAIGVSGPITPGASLEEARTQAAWALDRSVGTDGGMVRFTPVEPALAWLSARDDTLEELVQRTLGDLLAYDRTHRSSLLLTLRTYLDRDRQTGPAAAALHVHRHTLAYRLSRIERLTDRRLDHTADIVELWLSLSALSAFGADLAVDMAATDRREVVARGQLRTPSARNTVVQTNPD